MADINFESERLAQLMADVNRQMQEYGEVSQETQKKVYDANMKAKLGINNATAVMEGAGKAAGHLAKAGAEAAKAMYDNKKGATAFNSSMDSISSAATAAGAALMLMGGPVTMLIGGLTMLAGGVVKLAKVAGEQSDALYKGFQDLSKSGGAASDGMSGLFGDIQKLGLGFQDLESYTQLIASSSKELALFGGSVIDGRKQFANIGKSMEPFRESLFNAGMNQVEINEASMAYLRLQSRIGQTQNKTTQQLADGARKYLIEQDALTKLTGMTRKEQEDAREEIRSQERFAAKLMEMRAKGQNNEAKALEDTFLILKSQSKEAAQGFADVSTGMITTDAAQKSYLATQGESMRTAQRIQAGELNAAQGAQRVAAAHGATAKAMGATLGQMGVYNSTFGDLAADLRLEGMSEADIGKQLIKIQEDQLNQGVKGGKAADAAQQAQTAMRISQQNAMLALQDMVNDAVYPTTSAIGLFAEAVESATLMLTKMINFFGFGKPETKEETAAANAVNQRKREVMDLEWKVANARSEQDKKVAEQDLKASKSKLLDAQVAERYAKDRASGKTGAGMGGEQLRPDGSMVNPGDSDYSPPTPAAKSSRGMEMPPTPAATSSKGMEMPSTTGGPKEVSYRDYIKFTGGTGSESHFNKMQPDVKAAFAQMAQAYNASTGKKLQINSAFRTPEEQAGVNSGTNPKAAPGKSKHNVGRAVDIQSAQVRDLDSSGILQQFGFKTLANDPPHIFMRDGGVATGPESGYPATLHGTEAVIPLKNGAVPVSLDMKNALGPQGIGPTFGDYNQYTGLNSGPLSTDLDAVKSIAAKLGVYDSATKMITDPSVWKQILGSGIAMNYDMGVAEIGTKLLPGIGAEIGERIQELKQANDISTTDAIAQVAKEFKAAMADAIKNASGGDSALAGAQLSALTQLVQEQQNSNDLQRKLLTATAN
jgi:hypothetical protein